MENREAVLVLDFGTSGIRASLVDVKNGKILISSVIKNQWIRPEYGFFEMDADLLWENAVDAVKETVGKAAGRFRVISICFSFFGDSLIPADRSGRPLRNMIMAFDTRAQEEAAKLERTVGAKRFLEITGSRCLSMLVCSKIMWLRNHEPETYQKAEYFFNIQEFVLTKLGFGIHTDYTLAVRKALFDIREKKWSEEIAGGIETTISRLGGKVHESTFLLGETEWFGPFRLPYKIPVVLGAHDSECGFIGLGPGEDELANVSGTYEMVGRFVPADRELTIRPPAELGCGADKRSMILHGSSIAGSYIDWYRKELCRRPEDMFQEIEEKLIYDGRSRLYFLADNDRRTYTLHGLNTSTKEHQIYQAVIESITFSIKEAIEEIEQTAGRSYPGLRCGGGGSSSDKWLQLKADLLQKGVRRVENPEASAVGAAMIGAVGVGLYGDFSEASVQMVRTSRYFEPNREISEIYQKNYETYRSYMKVIKENFYENAH